MHKQNKRNVKLQSGGFLVGVIHCECDVLWQCCDYGMCLHGPRGNRQRGVRNGNIVFFIWHTGAAIYFDNDNAKRQRQPGIWNTHSHTHTQSSIIARSFQENMFAFYLWLFWFNRIIPQYTGLVKSDCFQPLYRLMRVCVCGLTLHMSIGPHNAIDTSPLSP